MTPFLFQTRQSFNCGCSLATVVSIHFYVRRVAEIQILRSEWKARHYGKAAYINGLIVIYRHNDFTRLDSYDIGTNRQVYSMLVCYPLSLSILCCSVPIVLFSVRFWLPKSNEMMAANVSLTAAYCSSIAAEIKQILLHKLQINIS